MATDGRKKKAALESIVGLFLAEFLGTGLLMFLGCMGCAVDPYSKLMIPHYFHALTFGLAVLICVQIIAHLSGAHLNPVVTTAAVVLGNLKPLIAIVYVTAQFTGASLGYGLLKLLLPDNYLVTEYTVYGEYDNVTVERPAFCATVPNPNISAIQAIGIEAVTSMVLTLVCCAVWDKRNSNNIDSISLRFGFIIAGIAMASAPFTSGSMNPARSFAPALLNGYWNSHYIYWVGPMLGSVMGSFFYKYVYQLPTETVLTVEQHHLDEIVEKDGVNNK